MSANPSDAVHSACGVTIYKTTLLQTLSKDPDLTYIFAAIDIWNCVEVNLVIMAASLPTLGPLVRETRKVSNKYLSYSTGSHWRRSGATPKSDHGSSDQKHPWFGRRSEAYAKFPGSTDTESGSRLVGSRLGRGAADAGDDMWLVDVDKAGRAGPGRQKSRVETLPVPGSVDYDVEREAMGSSAGIAMRTDVEVFQEDRKSALRR